MRLYSNKISLLQNGRGVYSLDTSVGCTSGTRHNRNGCYDECYAAKSAKIYGYDFTKTIYRNFVNESHVKSIVRELFRIKMPFVRIGTSGDPSENWDHTLSVIEQIGLTNKHIVIITKHWTQLTDRQISILKKYSVIVNTSVSALDNSFTLDRSMHEHSRLAKLIKSVLRVVTADFNLENSAGFEFDKIQKHITKNIKYIDTVLRVSKSNQLVKSGVIRAKKAKFIGNNSIISKHDKRAYMGKCNNCVELCGVSGQF